MSLHAYPDSPYFGSGVDVHTTDGLQLLWDGTQVLDMTSLAPREAFCGHTRRPEPVRENPMQYMSGGFRYRTGLTYLAVVIDTTNLGTIVAPRLQVIVNGVARMDTAIAGGLQTYSVSGMAGWGLVHEEVAEVLMLIYDATLGGPNLPGEPANPSDPQWGYYILIDAYVGPASATVTSSWPGAASFTAVSGSPYQTELLKLGNQGDHLARRMAAVPLPLFQRPISMRDVPYWVQLFTPGETEAPGSREIWSGGGPRGTRDRLVGRVVYLAGTATQYLRLRINGTAVATTPSFGPGQWGIHDFNVDLSGYAALAELRVEIDVVVTAGLAPGGRMSRFTVEYMGFARANPPFLPMTNRPEPDESTTWSERAIRLSALSGWLADLNNRLDADPDRWDRIRLFRSSYAYNRPQATILVSHYHAVSRQRLGARLVVRGSNLKLGYGPYTVELANPKEPDGFVTWKWGYEETLVSGDQVQTRELLLDTLPGLTYGMQYTVYGADCRYAAEELR